MNSNSNPGSLHGTPTPGRRPFSPTVFWTLAAIVGILAIVSRFWDLDAKPFHHDESLHAYYSHNVANGSVHKYDALLHGPFLYYFVGMFQFWAKAIHLDTSDFVARFPAALFGVLVVLSPLLVRRLLGGLGTLLMMALLLISPSTWYFGRFLREDVFTSIWVLGTLFGVALARTAADDRLVHGTLTLPGTKISTKVGDWLPGTPKTGAWCFAAAMLAFHFTNKENSYLHTALWLLGGGLIWFFSKLFSEEARPLPPSLPGESRRRILWCMGIFAFIFVVLYSSFFRHPDGWWNGVLDGLYRKSIVYWWGQDQQRRIDGPFDYHLPLLANYEFLLIPFLGMAWIRMMALSRQVNRLVRQGVSQSKEFFLTTDLGFWLSVGACVTLIALTLFLPRAALVSDGCGIADIPCSPSSTPPSCHGADKPWACLLHITHTRHLLQIISYITVGGMAFFAALHARRKMDAFLWFWLTGAIGTYSYVGEKVPWLLVYVLLPILLLAGCELARLFGGAELPAYAAEGEEDHAGVHATFSRKTMVFAALWLGFAVPLTLWKGWRVALPNAANPDERLVFTQTTPEIKALNNRMLAAAAGSSSGNVRMGMEGEATWPMAWYAQKFQSFDFLSSRGTRLSDIRGKARFDVLFLNDSGVDEIHTSLPDFDIYRVPLRAWWVPKPNPTYAQMLRYFFFLELYPGPQDEVSGKGSTQVLYLESRHPDSPFTSMPPLEFGKLLFGASPSQSSETSGTH